eukprot:GCRY01004995.1.p1 GENE.GCRY01004995.1~~GCRY01004995.1.p1  ORF type:complete len:486 (-),score=110.30 GCRY01004995.1:566-2023(-)
MLMMMSSQYSEVFWERNGFDVLVSHMDDGTNVLKEMHSFLEKRAEIEKKYAESLSNLAKSNAGNKDIGTLKNAWCTVKNETQKIANEHYTLCENIKFKLCQEVHKFADEQARTNRDFAKETKKISNEYEKMKKDVEKARISYYKCCHKLDQLEKTSEVPESSASAAKSQEKEQKANRAKETSRKDYVNLIDRCKKKRDAYVKQMTATCESFQVADEIRIDFCRSMIDSFVFYQLKVTPVIDEAARTILYARDDVSAQADIQTFINTSMTGSSLAPSPKFEEYDPALPMLKSRRSSFLGRRSSTSQAQSPIPPLPLTPSSSTHTPRNSSTRRLSQSQRRGSTHEQRERRGSYSDYPVGESERLDDSYAHSRKHRAREDSGGEAADLELNQDRDRDLEGSQRSNASSSQERSGRHVLYQAETGDGSEVDVVAKCIARYDYSATDSDQISFSRGALIDVTEIHPNGWWCGVCEGVQGVFPSNFVELLD